MAGIYRVLYGPTSTSTAITLCQWKGGDRASCELLRAHLSVTATAALAQYPVRLITTTTAATVTSQTPVCLSSRNGVALSLGSTTATGINASVEATGGTILTQIEEGFNTQSGWTWLATPEERIFIPEGGFLSLKLPTAFSPALTIVAYMVIAESGE